MLPQISPEKAKSGRGIRALWLAAGLVLVGIGVVGIFVPLLPTTDFLILALPCFARSSPRLERWLLEHPRFGPGLKAWRREGAVSWRAKLLACSGMGLGFALFVWRARPGFLSGAVVAGILLACAIWMLRRPTARTQGDGA